ncbi:hypothetical protein DW352_11720 [Pseudolabrys taiwanensis]|uniref:PIN domain-containing protein n=1 Tax=Pseudolabrys taiwanensis TaxID=331696 RepID=A0A345ZW27_9HYPH|nr:hypothetical protein [Pseudolabrys taiwanensis]AXK81124.1 hypothetical protein DW352_11720 [Pseudolabrys taiwanensis]
MLDTNIFDALVADPSTLAKLLAAVAEGRMTILSTHIQRDQLGRIPDDEKRAKVLAIPTEQIATSGAVWDVSRWGEATWGDTATNQALDQLIGGNVRHAPDALIGVTAAHHVDLLVTEDARLTSRLGRSALGLKVGGYQELVALL